MTGAKLQLLIDRLAETTRAWVGGRVDPLAQRVASLEARASAIMLLLTDGRKVGTSDIDVAAAYAKLESRLAALEARPTLRYCGAWDEGTEYHRGDFVTHAGSVWHCWQPTRDRPGASETWQLAVKRGRDAR